MSEEVDERPREQSWARELYQLFAPARAALHYESSTEINTEIDAALQEVRAEHQVIQQRD